MKQIIRDESPIRRTQLFEIYMYIFRHWYWKKHYESLRSSYFPFVAQGDLVFDIGANFGEHADSFLALGCRVIAAEPLPFCQPALHRLHPQKRVVILPVAVGATGGEITVHVNSEFPGMSTVSPEWLKLFKETTPSNQGKVWDAEIKVPMTTLDAMIREYGMPAFIKIDVEGYESAVLDGLTEAAKFMRFEFHSQSLNEAITCVRKPCFSASTQFNYSLGDPTGPLRLQEWLGAESFVNVLLQTNFEVEAYGDIHTRRVC